MNTNLAFKYVLICIVSFISFDATAQTKKTIRKKSKTAISANKPVIVADEELKPTPPPQNYIEFMDELKPNPSPTHSVDRPFVELEQMPSFVGGEGAMYKFITENLQYPAQVKAREIQGKVMIRFVVNKDGSISDAIILRGLDPECDSEALRVINMMPAWNAGKQNGKEESVYYTMPITFRLPQ